MINNDRAKSEILTMPDSTTRFDYDIEEEMNSLIYTLSHDMRAHFVTLTGLVEELTMMTDDLSGIITDIAEDASKDKKQYLNNILEDIPEFKRYIDHSVTQMDTYLQDLLILSRLGRRSLNPQKIQSSIMLEDVISKFVGMYSGADEINIAPLPNCFCDETSFAEVFYHVLKNAFQYRQPSQQCSISIAGEVVDDLVHFQVDDNGRGISESDQQKVFDPFFRVGWSDVQGHGMGLTYARKLVRMNEGFISCQSEEEVGTTIHLWLPKSR